MSGVLLVDKPAGPTSFGVVAAVRRALPRGTKVGHAGTLDPFATGLLVVLAGSSTRLAPYLVGLDKRYVTTVKLGVHSDTGDRDGELLPTGGALPSLRALQDACAALVGPQAQTPPATSAIRVDGRKAYERVRAGETVVMEPRDVTLYDLDILSHDAAAGVATLALRCSKGFYVRALARDLGEELGCGAYCDELRRTAVGSLLVDRAGSLDDVAVDLDGPWRIDPADALAHLPARELSEAELAETSRTGARPAAARRARADPLPHRRAARRHRRAGRRRAASPRRPRAGRMRILQGLDAARGGGPRVVALGTFDGVHLGHQRLIGEAVTSAQAAGARSTVLTFDPMPLEVLRPGAAPRRLSGIGRRAALVAEHGPDELVVTRFTHALSELDPERFVADVLAAALGAVRVVAGEEYRFGVRAEGDVDALHELGARYGFEVAAQPLLRIEGERVSSSWIRELVAKGEVSHAARLLGRDPWSTAGSCAATAAAASSACRPRTWRCRRGACGRPSASTPAGPRCRESAMARRSRSGATRPSATSGRSRSRPICWTSRPTSTACRSRCSSTASCATSCASRRSTT